MGEYVIKLPDIGEGVAEAELVEWNVAEGDLVREDQVLGSVMTDKASVEIPSPVAGKVTALGASLGETVAVGSVIVRLEVEGAGNSGAAEELPKAKAPVAEKAKPEMAKPTEKTSPNTPPAKDGVISSFRKKGDKPLASPSVRGRALKSGIDLRIVPGSGPIGRITHDDLDAFISGQSGQAKPSSGQARDTSSQEIPIIGMRRKIAERMVRSATEIPHITIVEKFDVTDIERLRASLNNKRTPDQAKLTLLPLLMRGLVTTLKSYPQMNAHYDPESNMLTQYGGVHIGIATQTERGLVVPVVKHCEALNIWEQAEQVLRLSESAREGGISRDELSGSTITISSLGALGGLATTPIINYPEVVIIGVNKMRVVPVWIDEKFVPRKVMNLSCSFDHRFIDGWDAAQFIHTLKGLIESPAEIFIGV